MSNQQVIRVTPAEMRKAVFGWIGNGITEDSIKHSFELFTAIFGYTYVGATQDDSAFFLQKSDMALLDGADYKLRPIAGLLVSVASVEKPLTPVAEPFAPPPPKAKAPKAKACGGNCTCTPEGSKADRVKVLTAAIKQLNRRHLKAGADVKHPCTFTEPKADLRIYLASDTKSYLAVLTSNPPKSVVGVQAKTLSELQDALTEVLRSIQDPNGYPVPMLDTETVEMTQFRKVFGIK